MRYLTLFSFFVIGLFACESVPDDQAWSHYLGDAAKSQFSAARQVNKSNVSQLEVAWSYSSNDVDENNRSQIQCNPLVIDGIVYLTTPTLQLVAVDGKDGSEIWRFNPFDDEFRMFGMGVNRGLAWFDDEQGGRIFYAAGQHLYAINRNDGSLVQDFGESGRVDLHTGLGEEAAQFFVVSNSPGIVYKELIIMGTRVS